MTKPAAQIHVFLKHSETPADHVLVARSLSVSIPTAELVRARPMALGVTSQNPVSGEFAPTAYFREMPTSRPSDLRYQIKLVAMFQYRLCRSHSMARREGFQRCSNVKGIGATAFWGAPSRWEVFGR
jgi:hypothetical protein